MEDRGSRGAGPLVIRPDSGDPPTVVCKVLEILGGQVVCVRSETHAKTLNKIEFRKHVTKKISGAFQPWSPTGRKSHISVSTFVAVKGPLKLKCLPVCPFSPYVLLKKTGASRSKRRHDFIHLQAGTRELRILHASAS